MAHDAHSTVHRAANSTPRSRGVLDKLRGSAKLRRPDGRSFYCSLLVADVDLVSSAVTTQPPLLPSGHDPEGIHAILWTGDVPVGEVTVPGLPETIVPRLPELAAE